MAMRILESAVDQTILVGKGIEVTVLEISAVSVRLGITTPTLDPSYREETIYLDGQPEDSRLEFAVR